jgi:hypothetical protein
VLEDGASGTTQGGDDDGSSPGSAEEASADATATATVTDATLTSATATDPTAGSSVTVTATSADDGDSNTDATDDGQSFVPAPDFGTVGEGEVCSLYEPNCFAGLKCVPADTDHSGWWDTGHCQPIDPNGHDLYESCSYAEGPFVGPDDCDAESFCFMLDEDGVGECFGYCLVPDPKAPWDYACEDPGAIPYIGCQECFCICMPQCNPLAQMCDDGQMCLPAGNEGFLCGVDASGAEGQIGDPCEYVNVCDPGLLCTNADAVPGCEGAIGCCSPFCDLDDGDSNCPSEWTCIPWFEDGRAPPGQEDVGVCGVG